MRTATSLLLLAISFRFFGCSKPAREGMTVPSSEPSANPPTTAAPVNTTLAPAALADVDARLLTKKLSCAGDLRRPSCRLLSEFGEGAPFNPRIPSGEGRFIGTAYTLEKGVEKSQLMLVSVSQVPTSTVPPGELAMKIGVGPMPDDKRDHGIKLVNALSHGDTVAKTNQAAPYVKGWKPSDAQGTMGTSGISTRLVKDEVYLRQGTSNKVLLLRLKPQAASGGAAEATLAELWPASW